MVQVMKHVALTSTAAAILAVLIRHGKPCTAVELGCAVRYGPAILIQADTQKAKHRERNRLLRPLQFLRKYGLIDRSPIIVRTGSGGGIIPAYVVTREGSIWLEQLQAERDAQK